MCSGNALNRKYLLKVVSYQSLLVGAGRTMSCRTPHVRQSTRVEGGRLIAHVPERQVPLRQGVHRTRISLLLRCPVMTREAIAHPIPGIMVCPAVSVAEGSVLRLFSEVRRAWSLASPKKKQFDRCASASRWQVHTNLG